MFKTIVVEPERTETYTEMVPVEKTRTIPAKNKRVEVGPGYLPVWLSLGLFGNRHEWVDNRTGPQKRDGMLYQTAGVGNLGQKYLDEATSSVRALLYVPADVTVEDTLKAYNETLKAGVAK